MSDPFENIDLDFDSPAETQNKQVEDELNLDDVVQTETPKKQEVVDEIDFSDEPVVQTQPIVDKVEVELANDPNTKENKQKELDAAEVKVEDPLADLDIELEAPKAEKKATKKRTQKEKAPKEKTPEENIAELGDILGDELSTPETPKEKAPIENDLNLDDIETPQTPKNDNRKIYLDPELNIEFLEKSTYQTRSVARSPEEIAELATLIRRQGQLEPIHVVIKGDIKYLVAGFGRVAALTLLKEKKAKAIIYENITEDEILKISSGTNTGRLELREWDKIASVGMYATKNPHVDIKMFPTIFGFEKSAIYDYINVYNFFKDKKQFVEYFGKVPLPQYMFKSLTKNLREFPDIDGAKVIGFVEEMLNYDKTTSTKFNYELSELMVKEKSKKEEVEKGKEFDQLDVDIGVDGADGKAAVNEALEKAVKEHKEENNSKSDYAAALCISMVKSLECILADILKLKTIEDYKKVVPSQSLTLLSKKLSEVQSKVVELM